MLPLYRKPTGGLRSIHDEVYAVPDLWHADASRIDWNLPCVLSGSFMRCNHRPGSHLARRMLKTGCIEITETLSKFFAARRLFASMALILLTGHPARASASIDFQVIHSVPLRSEGPVFAAIGSQAEVDALNRKLAVAHDEPAFLGPLGPEVDLQRFTLLVIGLGKKPSGGYAVVVSSVRESKEAILVNVLEIRPEKCAVIALITYPSTFLLIPKTIRPV